MTWSGWVQSGRQLWSPPGTLAGGGEVEIGRNSLHQQQQDHLPPPQTHPEKGLAVEILPIACNAGREGGRAPVASAVQQDQ